MLQIKNLSKSFNIGTENETTIFENFNFTVKDSEFVAVLGSNGAEIELLDVENLLFLI